jgi:hypothetical protein
VSRSWLNPASCCWSRPHGGRRTRGDTDADRRGPGGCHRFGRARQSAGAGSRSDDRREGMRARVTTERPGIDGMAPTALAPFARQRTVLLTTYRRNGTPVGTPVNIAVAADRAFVRTWDTTGKLKRIRNNPGVEVAPSTCAGARRVRAIRHGPDPGRRGVGRRRPRDWRASTPWVTASSCRSFTACGGTRRWHIELRPVLPNEPPPAAAGDGGERLDRGRGAWPTVVSALLPGAGAAIEGASQDGPRAAHRDRKDCTVDIVGDGGDGSSPGAHPEPLPALPRQG